MFASSLVLLLIGSQDEEEQHMLCTRQSLSDHVDAVLQSSVVDTADPFDYNDGFGMAHDRLSDVDQGNVVYSTLQQLEPAVKFDFEKYGANRFFPRH